MPLALACVSQRLHSPTEAYIVGTSYTWMPDSQAFAATRICTKCGADKPIEDYRPDPRYRGGRKRICRECERPYSAKHRNTPAFRQKAREDRASGKLLAMERRKRLRHRFGISIAEYDAMLAAQQGLCAICGRPPDATSRNPQINRLHIDHDHTTGRVRALLCCLCNWGIGHFQESPVLLDKAAAYLRAYHESEAM
jgi:hypothetical protein